MCYFQLAQYFFDKSTDSRNTHIHCTHTHTIFLTLCHAHLKIINILSSLVSPVYFGIQENFSLLLETLANKLHAAGLLVTAAVCADPTIAEVGYEFQKVGQ